MSKHVQLSLYLSSATNNSEIEIEIEIEIFVCFIPFIFLRFSVVFFLLHYLLAFHFYQG